MVLKGARNIIEGMCHASFFPNPKSTQNKKGFVGALGETDTRPLLRLSLPRYWTRGTPRAEGLKTAIASGPETALSRKSLRPEPAKKEEEERLLAEEGARKDQSCSYPVSRWPRVRTLSPPPAAFSADLPSSGRWYLSFFYRTQPIYSHLFPGGSGTAPSHSAPRLQVASLTRSSSWGAEKIF